MASKKLQRPAQSGAFTVSRKASAAVAAVEGLSLSPESRIRLANISHLGSEGQRNAIRAAYKVAKKG